ncbi:MAG: hypothetical protein K0U21_08680 [Proteobacteria bacterium]|nr:hypothetical protein [Pseudomonadota bacterium]
MTNNRNKLVNVALISAVAAVASVDALAGATVTGATADTTTFNSGKTAVQGWAIGDLGVGIATVAGIFGLMRAISGNIGPAAVGMGVAFLGAYSPEIINKIYSMPI